MSLTFEEVSLRGSIMPKQVLLVRGGALSSNTGIGGAHHNLATSLAEGEISGWSTSQVCGLDVAHPSLPTLIQSNAIDDCFGSQAPTLKVGMGRHTTLMMVDGKFPLRRVVHRESYTSAIRAQNLL